LLSVRQRFTDDVLLAVIGLPRVSLLDSQRMNNDDLQRLTVVPVTEGDRILNDENSNGLHHSAENIKNDRILALKMQCVNRAIDDIGFTSYQLKLFFLNGFGYAVDSLLILLNALTQPQVAMQYQPAISKAQTIAVGCGLLFGALFWGLGADVSSLVFHC
jgi:hypothetical protein